MIGEMDLLGLSQALTLPHNPIQPNFAIIRLPRGTNVPAFYALMCQFGFADVKFTVTAEGWQDAVPVVQNILSETTTPPQQVVPVDAPPSRDDTVVINISRPTDTVPTTLPQILLRLDNEIKEEESGNETTEQSPNTPGVADRSGSDCDVEDRAASTSMEDIVNTVLQLRRNRGPRAGSGLTRCQKCQRLLSCTSGSMISHAIAHYPVKRFECPLCKKQFFKKSMYLDHQKSGHPDSPALSAIDLRAETPTDGDPMRDEWKRVATECFPNHAHMFKSSK